MELKKYYRIKKIIVTHIDEIWGKSYGYYQELEKHLDGISFAYDGMEILIWSRLSKPRKKDVVCT